MHPREFSEYLTTEVGTEALRTVLLGNFCAHVDAFFWWSERKVFRWNRHHFDIVNALMDIFYGRVTYQIINVPPRYSKTELVVKLFTSWAYAKNPDCNFLHLSYSDDLACDNSDSVRETMRTPQYEQLFPDSALNRSKSSSKQWETKSGGEFRARASGGQITGFGAGAQDETCTETGNYRFYGAILIDDPLKPEDAYSDTERKKVNRKWNSTVKSRRNSPSSTPVICIMQRLHEDDYTAMLLKSKEFKFELLCLPALIEIRDDKGNVIRCEALWPEMHTVEMLIAMRDEDEYTYTGQYQQAPTPLGGGIFKKKWFRRWEALPPHFEKLIIFTDTAGKKGEENDYSVFQLWGLFECKIYLIDQIRGKWESPELVATATRVLNRWKTEYPSIKAWKVEEAAIAIGFIQTMRKQVTVPLFAKPRHRDKTTRAMSSAPYIQSGMVMFPPPRVEFAGDFEKEVVSFTANDSHAHDDQCDPMFDAVEEFFISPEVAGSVTLGGTH